MLSVLAVALHDRPGPPGLEARLLGREKAPPGHCPEGTEDEGGGQPSPLGNASGGKHPRRRSQVVSRRDQRQRGAAAAMAAGLTPWAAITSASCRLRGLRRMLSRTSQT